MKVLIEKSLDFFYPLFDKIFDRTTFRYAACGGMNTLFDISLFFFIYNYILDKQLVVLPFLTVSPHIASFLLSFCISFPTGFLLMRFVVFQSSYLKGRIQFFRYFITVCISIVLNYIFLKILVEEMKIYPTVSKIITTFFVVGFSYVSQRNFSFKSSESNKP